MYRHGSWWIRSQKSPHLEASDFSGKQDQGYLLEERASTEHRRKMKYESHGCGREVIKVQVKGKGSELRCWGLCISRSYSCRFGHSFTYLWLYFSSIVCIKTKPQQQRSKTNTCRTKEQPANLVQISPANSLLSHHETWGNADGD